MPKGIKHNIQCLCVLPQFRKSSNPPKHEFVVFSVIDNSDTIEPKLAQCNNCGVIHNIIDLCKSEIVTNREELVLLTKDDIKIMLPKPVIDLLENYNCDVPTWENALFILQEESWGEIIILERNKTEDGYDGKVLRFKGTNKYAIEPFIDRRVF
tara:strand:+ start:21236 stop:21697 length:462 start_codon:yes stop_codon:yes gene_type:complete